jgi:membrane-associated phospholipid phosphatase
LNRYQTVSIILLASFVILAILVSPLANNPDIVNGDTSAFLKVTNSHVSFLDKFMVWLTEYGREAFWGITVILLFIFGGMMGKKTAIVLVLAFIVLVPIGFAAKEIIHRQRPIIPESDALLVEDPNDYSYPSGHATIVSAGAAIALSLFRDPKKRFAISFALAAEAGLVCISRVYVGGHFPLDVVGGILLGVGIAFIFIGAIKQVERIMHYVERVLKRR